MAFIEEKAALVKEMKEITADGAEDILLRTRAWAERAIQCGQAHQKLPSMPASEIEAFVARISVAPSLLKRFSKEYILSADNLIGTFIILLLEEAVSPPVPPPSPTVCAF